MAILHSLSAINKVVMCIIIGVHRFVITCNRDLLVDLVGLGSRYYLLLTLGLAGLRFGHF